MSTSPAPSEEQQEIITKIQEGNNIIVDAVAGSGKTTTLLFLASALPDKKILAITYNSRLKAETRERTSKLPNVKVHSYHSCGLEFYIKPCHDDMALLTTIQKGLPCYSDYDPTYCPDIIVLDETQDMTPIYYNFIRKVIDDMNPNAQLLILGDVMQCIYDFPQKGADRRYLSHADELFPSPHAWQRLTLKTSYRITKPMEWYVNERILGYPRMKSVKSSSHPVRYVKGECFNVVPDFFARELCRLFKTGIRPGDVFVLAPTIRASKPATPPPIKILENLLVKAGVPCFGPTNDDETLKDNVIHGKVVFSNFHQCKGLERKVVIVCAFSESFYFVQRDASTVVCPNLLYVAATRAKEALYLWGENTEKLENPLPFLREADAPPGFYEVYDLTVPSRVPTKPPLTPPPKEFITRGVTDLIRFIPEELMQMMLDLCGFETITPAGASVPIPSTVDTKNGRCESVSDLNGIAIPTMYEHMISPQDISIQEQLKLDCLTQLQLGQDFTGQRAKWVAAITTEPKTAADFLLLANVYSSYRTNFLHKLAQIRDYTWLTDTMVDTLLTTLTATIKTDSVEPLQFEEKLAIDFYQFGGYIINIIGFADLIDDDTLWELKCVDTLTAEHKIQLAFYAWMWRRTHEDSRRFCLHNIRTGEVQQLMGLDNLDYVVDIVLDNHFKIATAYTDEEFVERCKNGAVTGGGIRRSTSAPAVLCQIVD